MDWFLYDIGLRHERVKQVHQLLFSLKSAGRIEVISFKDF